jgi:hypothetical protein
MLRRISSRSDTYLPRAMADPANEESNWNWEAMRDRSRALFGSPNRLAAAVLVAMAEPNRVYAAEIAGATGMTPAEAGRQLRRFEAVSLVEPTDAPPDEPRRRGQPAQYVKRVEHPFWSSALKLAEHYRKGGDG